MEANEAERWFIIGRYIEIGDSEVMKFILNDRNLPQLTENELKVANKIFLDLRDLVKKIKEIAADLEPLREL